MAGKSRLIRSWGAQSHVRPKPYLRKSANLRTLHLSESDRLTCASWATATSHAHCPASDRRSSWWATHRGRSTRSSRCWRQNAVSWRHSWFRSPGANTDTVRDTNALLRCTVTSRRFSSWVDKRDRAHVETQRVVLPDRGRKTLRHNSVWRLVPRRTTSPLRRHSRRRAMPTSRLDRPLPSTLPRHFPNFRSSSSRPPAPRASPSRWPSSRHVQHHYVGTARVARLRTRDRVTARGRPADQRPVEAPFIP